MGLALLAPISLLASDLPNALAWPLAALVAACAVRTARHYAQMPPLALQLSPGSAVSLCDGERIDSLRMLWRGPLGFLAWRDGRGQVRRLVLWPDVVNAMQRRELRLAMQRFEAASRAASVAG